ERDAAIHAARRLARHLAIGQRLDEFRPGLLARVRLVIMPIVTLDLQEPGGLAHHYPSYAKKKLFRGSAALGLKIEQSAAVIVRHDLDEQLQRLVPILQDAARPCAARVEQMTLDEDEQALGVEAQQIAHAAVI